MSFDKSTVEEAVLSSFGELGYHCLRSRTGAGRSGGVAGFERFVRPQRMSRARRFERPPQSSTRR